MLRKFLILALLFHFGEFTNIGRDKASQRFGATDNQPAVNQASTFNADSYFNNKQNSEPQQMIARPQNQQTPPPYPYQTPIQNQQVSIVNKNQQSPSVYQNQQSSNLNQNQQSPNVYQNQQSPNVNQNQQIPYVDKNQVIKFESEEIETSTYRSKFDRTSMTSSGENTQKPDQRPAYDNFGDDKKKFNQEETSPTSVNEKAGINRDQLPVYKQGVYIEHYNKPDEDKIIIPNMPNKIVELIFPPTLSYDEDATTTTRASIFDSNRRKITTERSYTPR
ncbi:uncharacterized protein DDB_G0290301-like isoform X2 [Chironomus tepperi]|uniref:uncharacterized protein DDB_G0290301-like isoform X2 n=1 Tax=Chironomus tepperi TaxID=113505 RepID=UPI00391F4326